MIYFGKDLVESERRFEVVRAGYFALCSWVAAPAAALFWHFRPDQHLAAVIAVAAVVAGISSTLKCWSAGMGRTACDCEERHRGGGS